MTSAASSRTAVRQDYWWWRLFATGFCFVLFGLGGVLLRLLVFPAQRLYSSNPHTRQRRARRAIHGSFRLLVRVMRVLGVLTMEVRGLERLGKPGQMIVANHPSLLDVVFLISLIPDANCIVKYSLARNVFTRGPVAASGYITNDESMEMFERAVQVLQAGETLIVFPEGTRTPPGAMPRLHRGACAIALRGARYVTPVVIKLTPPSLVKGEPWYRVAPRRMHYLIEVGEDTALDHWRDTLPLPIAGRKMQAWLHAWFAAALGPANRPRTPSDPSHLL